jgi:hypothetical protein
LIESEEWGINDHSAMIEKMHASKIFEEELTRDQIDNLAAYFLILPSEVAMKLWTVVGDNDCVENCIKLHKAEVDGVKISEHLVKILRWWWTVDLYALITSLVTKKARAK